MNDTLEARARTYACHLHASCRELDDIVRKIAETLDKGGHFSREDFGK